jgi:hypothetical protein
MSTPTTTREYLKAQGITVGKRGRFSAAAKNAIQEAAKNVVPCSLWWETGRVAGIHPF